VIKLWWLTAAAQAMLAGGTALQAFLLLHASGQQVFGQFALVMLWFGLSSSLLSALTGAPMLIRQQAYAQALWLRVHRWLALLLASAGLGAFLLWQLPLWPALLFAVSHYCLLSRTLQRQLLHQQGQSRLAAWQDFSFGLFIATLTLVLFYYDQLNLAQLALLNAVAALLLQLALHWQAKALLRSRRTRLRRGYVLLLDGLRHQGRAALTGVLAVELMANGYLYLLGSVAGPALVAPFAAVLLLFRPVAVLVQGVSQRWRPDLWLLVQQQASVRSLVRRAISFGVLLVIGNLLVAWLLLTCWPALVWPGQSASQVLELLPWVALLVLVRIIRQPLVLLLQAQNRFGLLSRSELYPALCLIPAALLLLWLQWPVIWLMIAALVAETAVTVRLVLVQKDLQ